MIPRQPPSRLAAAALLACSAAAAAAADFTIDTTVNTAQTLSPGNGVVTATGVLSVGGSAVAVGVSGSGDSSIENRGVVEQTGTGRAIRFTQNGQTLSLTNAAGARIESTAADTVQVNQANASISVVNSGSIRALAGGQALDFNDIATGSNRVTNDFGGLVSALGEDAIRPGDHGVILNAGTIRATPSVQGSAPNRTPSGSDGIDAVANGGVQATNSGTISGRHGITGGGTSTPIAISATNEAGGLIEGQNGSGINIDGVLSIATVTNRGTIAGRFDSMRYDSGDGDGVDVDGSVTLTNWGTISGTDASAGSNPEGVSIGGGSVTNQAGAQIFGQATLGNGAKGQGLLVDDSNGGNAIAATQLSNAGTIRGYQGFGVKMIGGFADTVDNRSGGLLQGAGAEAALQTGGGNDQVTNGGSVVGEGGLAIDLGDGEDNLRISGGAASVTGSISGGAGTDTLAIDAGAGNGFTYQGVLTGFETMRVDSGTAALGGSLDGTLSVGAGSILAPGNSVGTLDLGGLALAASGALAVELDPANIQGNGTHDLLRVSGSVELGLADLILSLFSAPTPGQQFDILLNAGDDAIGGRFAQGDWVSANLGADRYWFVLGYGANGDGGALGNDLRLTAVAAPLPGSVWLLALGALGLWPGGRGQRSRAEARGPSRRGLGPARKTGPRTSALPDRFRGAPKS